MHSSRSTVPRFTHDQVPMSVLRQRAYNLRWATVEHDVLTLTAADPDFPVAEPIREAIQRYVAPGVLSYGPPEGLPEFREAAAQMLEERRGVRSAADHIVPTDGAASGMFALAKLLLRPGDEAIVYDPVDFLFAASVEAAGATVVRCAIDPERPVFDVETLRACVTERTRLICLCNPHNPLGRVLTEQELAAIGEVAVANDLMILSDEIWSDIVYAPRRFTSIARVDPSVAERTFHLYGFSKTFGLAGLRVGFVAAPSAAHATALRNASRADTTAYGVSTISQVAATAAYQHGFPWAEAFLQHLHGMRDEVVARLNAMPGVRCACPEGTYVVFPDVSELGMESTELTDYLRAQARVAVVPGDPRWFGPGSAGHIRICFATSRRILDEAMDRIEVALRRL